MSWNIVLNKIIEIKNEYKKVVGDISYDYLYIDENKYNTETCLERWVTELIEKKNISKYLEYKEILSNLILNQYKNMILIRYGKFDKIYGGKYSVEEFWNQYNGFYRECRSLVIDIENDCIVLSPYSKFFNINEIEETKLENIYKKIDVAKNIEISDKLDGSMQVARWYNNEIIMSGSESIDPSVSWRLKDGYKIIKNLSNYKKMLMDYPNYTFIFEYISLKDAHVVKYKKEEEGLYLIGIRDVNTGEEYNYNIVLNIAKKYNVLTTKLFNKTLDQILTELDDKTSDEAEGFVINIDGYKVKLKYNDYIHIHRILSKITSINLIIEIIANDKYDDLISKIPKLYYERVQAIALLISNYITEMDKLVKEYVNNSPQINKKEFMLYISKNIPKKYQAYCINMYLGNKNNYLKNKNGKYKKIKEIEEFFDEN